MVSQKGACCQALLAVSVGILTCYHSWQHASYVWSGVLDLILYLYHGMIACSLHQLRLKSVRAFSVPRVLSVTTLRYITSFITNRVYLITLYKSIIRLTSHFVNLLFDKNCLYKSPFLKGKPIVHVHCWYDFHQTIRDPLNNHVVHLEYIMWTELIRTRHRIPLRYMVVCIQAVMEFIIREP